MVGRFSMAIAAATLLLPLCQAKSSGKPWSIAAAGDILGDIVATQDSRTDAVFDIVRSADFGFFNMEGQIFSRDNFTGYPASENGGDNGYGGIGGGPSYEPVEAFRLAQHGFSLASHVNNHAWDYELAGAEATRQYLEDAGIAVSGSGSSLAEARQAAFESEGKRRISLVSAAGSHTPQSVAGAGGGRRGDLPRPGVNVLRATPVTRLESTESEALQKIALAQGQELAAGVSDITLYTGQHSLSWSNWRLADKAGIDWDIAGAHL
ncbi:hypothetical protein ACJ41O_005774 [Fusarium nematophilum]